MKQTIKKFIYYILVFSCVVTIFENVNAKKANAENITLHVWVSETSMGDQIRSSVYSSRWVYLCYELIDSSGKKLDNSYSNYQVTLYQYSPKNEIINQYTYDNSNYNWISVKNSGIGRFTGKVCVTGSITMDCGVEWHQIDSTPTLSLSQSNLSLHMENEKSSTVICKVGGDIFNESFHLSVVNSAPSVVSTSCGSWYSNREKSDLTVTAKTAGSATLTVKLVKADDTVLASKEISVTVKESEKKTYVISYNANGGMNTPLSQTKVEGTDLRLSSDVPSKSYTINYVTGYSTTVSSRIRACIFDSWNTSSAERGTKYASGSLYTKDEGVTLYAIWSNPELLSSDLPELTRDGYDFLGWYTASIGGSKINAHEEIVSDLTLYAHWMLKEGSSPTSMPIATPSSIAPTVEPAIKSTKKPTASPFVRPSQTRKPQVITAASYVKTYGSKAFYINAKTNGDGRLFYGGANKKVAAVNQNGRVIVKGYGKTTVKITASGTDRYQSAAKKIAITVIPKKAVISSLSSRRKGQIVCRVRKQKDVTGYEFMIGTLSGKKYSAKTKKLVFKTRFASKTKYLVRVRAFKKVGGRMYAGAWSMRKTIKTK